MLEKQRRREWEENGLNRRERKEIQRKRKRKMVKHACRGREGSSVKSVSMKSTNMTPHNQSITKTQKNFAT